MSGRILAKAIFSSRSSRCTIDVRQRNLKYEFNVLRLDIIPVKSFSIILAFHIFSFYSHNLNLYISYIIYLLHVKQSQSTLMKYFRLARSWNIIFAICCVVVERYKIFSVYKVLKIKKASEENWRMTQDSIFIFLQGIFIDSWKCGRQIYFGNHRNSSWRVQKYSRVEDNHLMSRRFESESNRSQYAQVTREIL